MRKKDEDLVLNKTTFTCRMKIVSPIFSAIIGALFCLQNSRLDDSLYVETSTMFTKQIRGNAMRQNIVNFSNRLTWVQSRTFGDGRELGRGRQINGVQIVMDNNPRTLASARGRNGTYVDTGQYNFGYGNTRFYTDTVSWCVALAVWDGTRCFLAHMSPGQSPIGVGLALKRCFGNRITQNMRFCLVSMGVHIDNARNSNGTSAIGDVMNAIDVAFPRDGWERAALRATLVTGYCGIKWDQRWTLAVQTYGAFVFSDRLGKYVY